MLGCDVPYGCSSQRGGGRGGLPDRPHHLSTVCACMWVLLPGANGWLFVQLVCSSWAHDLLML